jgi:hypothetical protein
MKVLREDVAFRVVAVVLCIFGVCGEAPSTDAKLPIWLPTTVEGWATVTLAFSTLGLMYATSVLARKTGVLSKFTEEQRREIAEQRAFVESQRIKILTDRLFDFDKLHMAYPNIQLKLERLRDEGSSFLSCPRDAEFVQLKAFIYMRLNFFDEIVSTYEDRPEGERVEIDDWRGYIVNKLRHPAYKEVWAAESQFFGQQLRDFVEKNKSAIEANNGEPWQF